jgi:hypothetical protein
MNGMNARKELIRIAIAVLLLAACLLMPGRAESSSGQAEQKTGVAVLIDNLKAAVSSAGGK